MGRRESRGVRTVSAGGRTSRRRKPGRRSDERRESRRLVRCGHHRGQQATGERRHCGRLGVLSRGPPHEHPFPATGKHQRARLRPVGQPSAAAHAYQLGGGAKDHDPPASYRPGGSAQERAKPRLGSICDQSWLSRDHGRDGAAGAPFRRAGARRRMDISARRHVAFGGDGRSSPGRARFLLREPERSRRSPAALVRQLPRELGNPRVAAAKARRLGKFLVRQLIAPIRDAQGERAGLPRGSGGTGWSPRTTAAGAGSLACLNLRRQAAAHAGV